MNKLTKLDKDALERWRLKCIEISTATEAKVAKETKQAKAKRLERIKSDYNYYVHYYFSHYAKSDCGYFQIEAAEAILKDKNIFAILEWAREHAKSVHACLFIPIWLLIHGELEGMLLANQTLDGAKILLGDLQAELEHNHLLINDIGEQFQFGSWADGDFTTKNDIRFIALGRGQSPRGLRNKEKRPNYGVCDDMDDEELVKNKKRVKQVVAWILKAFYGALSIKGARIVITNNRIARYSVLAHLVGDVEPGDEKREGIWHSKINALDADGNVVWKENFTKEEILRKIQVMGYIYSRSEYFNEGIVEGTVFKEEWIQWKPMSDLSIYDCSVIYIDPSFKSTGDYKAVRHWGKLPREFHLINCFVRQCSIHEMVCWIYDYYETLVPGLKDNCLIPVTAPDIYMEANFMQDLILDDFTAEGEIRGWQLPIAGDYRAKPDKVSRIMQTSPFYERGLIWYNELFKNSKDMKAGKEQVIAFEEGSTVNDDAPDADEGAIFKLQRMGRAKATPPRLGVRPQRGW